MNTTQYLIFVRGLPGSGKSYLSEAIVSALGSEKITLIDPDTVDMKNASYKELSAILSAEGLDPAIHPFRWLRKTACDAITSGKSVIWNQPFTDRGVFDRLLKFIQENSTHKTDLQVLVIEVELDPILAKKRIDKRIANGGHGPSTTTFQHRVKLYESFSDRYQVLSIDGDKPIDKSVQKILDRLHQ